jgi:hypothetical protein
VRSESVLVLVGLVTSRRKSTGCRTKSRIDLVPPARRVFLSTPKACHHGRPRGCSGPSCPSRWCTRGSKVQVGTFTGTVASRGLAGSASRGSRARPGPCRTSPSTSPLHGRGLIPVLGAVASGSSFPMWRTPGGGTRGRHRGLAGRSRGLSPRP